MAKQHYSSFQCHMILRIFNIINVENIFEDFLNGRIYKYMALQRIHILNSLKNKVFIT